MLDIDYPLLESTNMTSEEENSDADYHGVEVKPKQSIGLEKSTPFTVSSVQFWKEAQPFPNIHKHILSTIGLWRFFAK